MRKELILPATALLGGAAGFSLRWWGLRTAFEPESGLPIPGMPATWLLAALTGTMALLLGLLCRGVDRGFSGGYDEAFQARGNILYVAGMVAAAFLTAIAGALLLLEVPALYEEATNQLRGLPMLSLLPRALLAALCLGAAWSLFRLGRNNYKGEGRGRYSAFLLIPSYTACMWLIVSYQARSGDPVILDYVYQLLAIIAAVLGSYYMAGFGFERAKVFRGAFFSLTAMYLIPVTLADAHTLAYQLLYGGFLLYFVSSTAVLLYNTGSSGSRAPGGKRLMTHEKQTREGTPDEG